MHKMFPTFNEGKRLPMELIQMVLKKNYLISEMLPSRWLWSDNLVFLQCSLMFVWMKMEVHVEKTKLLYNYMIVYNERICESHIHSWYITVFSGCNTIKLGKSQCQTQFPTFDKTKQPLLVTHHHRLQTVCHNCDRRQQRFFFPFF